MHGVRSVNGLGQTVSEYRERIELRYRNKHKPPAGEYPIDRGGRPRSPPGAGGGRLDCSDDVHDRKLGFGGDAVPQVDGQADVTGPERVATTPERRTSFPNLVDRHRGERPGPLQPKRVPRSLVELQQRVAVSARAVTQVRSLGQRPGVPGQLSPLQQQGLEVRRRERGVRERGDHPRRPVAVLAQMGGLATRHGGRPLRAQLGSHRVRREGARNSLGHLGALVGRQPVPAAEEGHHVPGEAMHRSEPALDFAIQLLAPDGAVVGRLKFGQQPARLRLEQRLEPAIPGHGAHVHAGQHGAGQPPHELQGWQVGVCRRQGVDPVGEASRRRDAHRDQPDAQLTHQQRPVSGIG